MIQFEIKAPIGREYDGNEYTIKCMDPGVTFAVELFTVEPISPWRERAIPYQIPEGSTATLRVTRPDRAYTNTKTTIEGGIIFCPVHPYSVATPGKCSADVAVYGPDGNRITSATFHFFVDRECAPTAGENAPVFVDSIQGLIEFVEQAADRAEAAADRAESSGGGNGSNPPKDGITPHIGENGNWYIGTTDTGVSAEGEDGEDGGHYTPVVTQPTTDTIRITLTPSKATMPAVAPVTVQLPVPSESNGAGEHPDNPVVDGITVGGENGVRFDSEGKPSAPILALYGAQGDEPVRVSHVATAQEDGEAVPLGQVKQLVKEHSGQNVNQYEFLKGLKYYALGDSITEIQGTTADPKLFGNWYTTDLQGRDLREITVSGYVQAIESRYGLAATNYGKSGHTLVGDFSTLVTKDYSDVALVTIAYGVNDARSGVPLGTVNSTDTATFAGALNQLLRKIYTDNPECRVLVLAPLQRLYVSEFGIATPNANGNYLIDFVNMCRAIAEKRSTAFLDQYRCTGINQTNLYYYTVEGVHPVNQGFSRIKNAVIGILDELFAVEYNPFGTMANTGDTEPEEPEIDNGGGTETPPTEDTTGGSIDLTGLFVLDKVISDGYVADGKRIGESGYQANSSYVSTEATELPAGRVYTITTYLSKDGVYAGYVHNTPERQKWDDAQGKYVPNGFGAQIKAGLDDTWEEVTIDGTVYKKITHSVNASQETKYAWIGCKRGMEDRVTVTYV